MRNNNVSQEEITNSRLMPKPVENDERPVWDYVIDDVRKKANQYKHAHYLIGLMENRKDFGFKKYGTYLQVHNGRPVEIDLLQELLDSVVYAKQMVLERNGDLQAETIYQNCLMNLKLAVNYFFKD